MEEEEDADFVKNHLYQDQDEVMMRFIVNIMNKWRRRKMLIL